MRDAEARMAANMPEGFEGDTHALLVAVYRDTSLPLPIRLDTAKAAVKFEKPALAATTFTKPDSLGELTVDELRGLKVLMATRRRRSSAWSSTYGRLIILKTSKSSTLVGPLPVG
jgi:hypothetical protein